MDQPLRRNWVGTTEGALTFSLLQWNTLADRLALGSFPASPPDSLAWSARGPRLLAELIILKGATAVINTGCEKVRLATPVTAGSRLRMSGEIKAARNLPGGGVRASFALRFEVEGEPKPALSATVVFVYAE